MLKKEWGAEGKGKLPHLFIPSKTATLVHEFAMENLLLDRIATLGPTFAVKDLPLGRILDDDDYDYDEIYIYIRIYIYSFLFHKRI